MFLFVALASVCTPHRLSANYHDFPYKKIVCHVECHAVQKFSPRSKTFQSPKAWEKKLILKNTIISLALARFEVMK